jgi:HD-like signal output (HDOD) protein
MHDIGKLILAVNLRQSYQEALDVSARKEMPLWQAEHQIFGTTHAEIGAHLLGLWGLPNSVVEAVAFHHRPNEAKHAEFTPLTAVHIADALQQTHSQSTQNENVRDIDTRYLELIGVSEQLSSWRNLALKVPKA